MSDISRFKWAENVQRTRMEEALEAKQKHENFIDMTSHEMRNPLSAVMQCADSSIDTLKTVLALKSKLICSDTKLSKHIDNEIKLCLDSMNTIISCSIHQKRVIDDVLTLSKMDSNLLATTPVRAEPAVIVADAVHMFQIECSKDDQDDLCRGPIAP
jgi:signal transduction histidine kinase